jgi:peroxiredoxin
VKPFLEREKINYRVVLGDDHVAQLYGGVESLPTTFMIDRSGRIAAIHVGLVSKRDYQNDITNLINARKSSLHRMDHAPLPALLLGPR